MQNKPFKKTFDLISSTCAMRIPPKKPHFFKPLLPGFKNGITIPPNFFRFLNGTKHEKAVLKRAGREWHVKMNLRKLGDDGWKHFSEDNDLHVGDFAVFRHEGNMVFEVLLFDPSTCLKECSTHMIKVEPAETKEAEEERSLGYLQSKELKRRSKAAPVAETISSKERPHFVSFIKPFNVKYSHLYVPTKFAKENGLLKDYCKITLVDDLQRSWPMVLRHNKSHVYIGCGWVDFREANGLKVGDRFKFEIIKTGKTPVVNFNIELKKGPKETPVAETISCRQKATPVAETLSSRECPHFVSSIKPYNVKSPRLPLPKEFAKQNGLMKKFCKLILVDDRHRSWPVVLRHNKSYISIGSGWVTFREANDLKAGDRFKFEIIKNGKTPVVNFIALGRPLRKDCSRRDDENVDMD
ncbi:hypothetical protein LIER_00091 [Lithospermum erythrorhizon]|uniref:TF-B3 domain-containing protein n=1 Tax=Lithospermum erythrorhizon TaxID=34254 RepID=A0AAV3NHQ2_LITER